MSKVYEEKSTKYFKGTKNSRLSTSDGLERIPSELVTDDPKDAARIHAVDPDHVKHDILNEYIKNDGKPTHTENNQDVRKKHTFHQGKVSERGQGAIDVIRLSVTSAVLGACTDAIKAGRTPDLSVRHLWFPKDDLSVYELRHGNPPSDSTRPAHLKRLKLEIDPNVVPPYLEEAMKRSSAGQSDLKELQSLQQGMSSGRNEPGLIIT